jgi:hypothetical protein
MVDFRYDTSMAAGIFTAHSTATDTADAVAQCRALLPAEPAEFVLLLNGPNHTGEVLEHALQSLNNSPVYGCSTAGEIIPAGYRENTLTTLCFSSEYFTCVSRHIQGLGQFGFQQAGQLVPAMLDELHQRAPDATASSTFALLLIDSTSRAEEFVAAALGSELGNINLVGGSAGDNWQLGRTPVLFDGRFADDSAVLLLVHSSLPFRHYNFHNFVPTQKRGVITAATPSERLVHEINGAPALLEYARLCGLRPDEINREHLALHPAIITVGDRAYPRGFAEILDDGSLRSACAIDEGVVFRVAAQVDYIQQMRGALNQIRDDLGDHLLVLGMECAARREMVEQHKLQEPVAQLFTEFNIWGFNCMGEQSNSLNMNNSFNCLAFALPE